MRKMRIQKLQASRRLVLRVLPRPCVVFKDEQGWITRTWECTTDPGAYWLENPMNAGGTAILVPGQYRGVYKIDKHRGLYDALCQRGGTVKCYRDKNKDDVIDMDPDSVTEGMYGINLHKAGSSSTLVNALPEFVGYPAGPGRFAGIWETEHLKTIQTFKNLIFF